MSAGWQEVAEGILVRRHAHLDLNCGLVLGEGACLVVDTRSHLDDAAELAAAVRAVTPHPWTVVNTHAHYDHCARARGVPARHGLGVARLRRRTDGDGGRPAGGRRRRAAGGRRRAGCGARAGGAGRPARRAGRRDRRPRRRRP